MKYGLIGNCSYQALLDERARVVFLCWPRFDSSFVFGSLLDEEQGGEFSILPAEGPVAPEQSYLPNTNILRTVFESPTGSYELTDFAPRFQQYERYFKPTMLVRRIKPLSGAPQVRIRCNPVYDYARIKPALYQASNHIQWLIPNAQLRLTTNVPLSYITESRSFALERTAYVVVTWGTPLEAALEETCESFLARTRRYWESWVKHTALPGVFQTEVIRSALALKLHQYEDTGAITAATTTSLPEYPNSGRNWDYRYCWLRDAYFTLRAMRRLGHFEELEAYASYMRNRAEASPDRIQPVYAISGESDLHEVVLDHLSGYRGNTPVRAGNAAYLQVQHDVYGELLAAIAPLYLDIRFSGTASELSDRLVRRLVQGSTDTLESPDAGIWEYRGEQRVHTFSLLMHWFGARIAERVAERVGDADLGRMATDLEKRARGLMEDKCFRKDRGYYADALTTDNADASLMMMVNLGYLDRNHPNAESHIRALAKDLSLKDYLIRRYRHHDGIGETHATFTVCGFWYAEALARLGHFDEAIRACEQIISYANPLGLFSEDVDPATGEQWGNFPQTYSHVGLINAAFAISPAPNEVGDP